MNNMYIAICVISIMLTSCNFKNENDLLINVGYHNSQETSEILQDAKNDIFNNLSHIHYGMDISHFQGNIVDAINVKDSLRFIICKATQGDSFVDPDFRMNWREIEEKGLIRGTYHFYVCTDDPLDQANHFINNASDITTKDIAPILDIEQGSMSKNVSADQMEKDILIFLKIVEQKTKRKPIIYTDYAFAQEYLKNSIFAEYDLWLAEYTSDKNPRIPDTWKNRGFKIWQKTASYNLDSRMADLDVYYGLLKDIVK